MADAFSFLTRNQPNTATQKIGIAGYTAFATVRENTVLSSEITSTSVEDGSVLNDHINRKSKMLKIEGKVGDIVIESTADELTSSFTSDAVGVITQLAPLRTLFQQSKIGQYANRISTEYDRINRIIEGASQPLNILGNQSTLSKGYQERFIDAMEALHDSEQIIDIETSYRLHKSMAIKSFMYDTTSDDKMVSFSIEAMEIRIADLTVIRGREIAVSRPAGGGTVGGGARNPSAASSAQVQGVKDKGVQSGAEVTEEQSESILSVLIR